MSPLAVRLQKVRADQQRSRLFDCLNRFVRVEDRHLTDAALVRQVFVRWAADREEHIGDCGDGVDLTGLFNG